MAPVATDLAARLLPQDICKFRANAPKAPIGKFAHESGKIAQTLERFAPGEAGGWSDSPQGVERIAPLGTSSGQPFGTRLSRKTGTGADEGDSAAACGRKTPGSAPWSRGQINPGAENRSRPGFLGRSRPRFPLVLGVALRRTLGSLLVTVPGRVAPAVMVVVVQGE